MLQPRILIWYRNDLRLHDHEPLYRAVNAQNLGNLQIIPLYCFDPRQFGKTSFGFQKQEYFVSSFYWKAWRTCASH